MVNTFFKYLSIPGAILAIFCQVKEKIDLTYLTGDFYCHFLHTKNTQEGRAFMRSRNRFPLTQFLCNGVNSATKMHVSQGIGVH